MLSFTNMEAIKWNLFTYHTAQCDNISNTKKLLVIVLHAHLLWEPCAYSISPPGCPLSSLQQAVGYSAGFIYKLGRAGGNRTHKVSLPADFKSAASANSATAPF